MALVVSSGHEERSASGMYRHCTSKPAAVKPGSCGDIAWAQPEYSLSNTGGMRRHLVRSRSMCSNTMLVLSHEVHERMPARGSSADLSCAVGAREVYKQCCSGRRVLDPRMQQAQLQQQ
jgi:hypothetical protein